jgi:uncharacterized membrane protein
LTLGRGCRPRDAPACRGVRSSFQPGAPVKLLAHRPMALGASRIVWRVVWLVAIASLFVWGFGRFFPSVPVAARLLIALLVYAVYMEGSREPSAEDLAEIQAEEDAEYGDETNASGQPAPTEVSEGNERHSDQK